MTTGEAREHVERLFGRELNQNTLKGWLRRERNWPGLYKSGSGRLAWSCFAVEFLCCLVVNRLGWQYANQNSETNN